MLSGVLLLLIIALAFTDIPYFACRNLSKESDTLSSSPDFIIVLGGSGMPSPDGLIRTYYAAKKGQRFPAAKIIIAHPYCTTDSLLQLGLMQKELLIRGVDSSRITFAPEGFNTHSQAENIRHLLGEKNLQKKFLIISSPEHMYRAVKTFRKSGFQHVGSLPAFDKPLDEANIKDKKIHDGPSVKNLRMRYNFWSYLHYEVSAMREYCAIAYYKAKGWL